jgi:mannose-6-phosphate isomerase-like protein (cupin superfamily)
VCRSLIFNVTTGIHMPQAITLTDKLATFTETFQPHTVATFNRHDIMVVKIKGEFRWHSHAETDDFFLVLKGQMRIDMEDGTVHLNEGDLFVVPRGMQHRPVADEECHVLLIEPTGTPNTGDAQTAQPRRVI